MAGLVTVKDIQDAIMAAATSAVTGAITSKIPGGMTDINKAITTVTDIPKTLEDAKKNITETVTTQVSAKLLEQNNTLNEKVAAAVGALPTSNASANNASANNASANNASANNESANNASANNAVSGSPGSNEEGGGEGMMGGGLCRRCRRCSRKMRRKYARRTRGKSRV
jgi:hypothetical protein